MSRLPIALLWLCIPCVAAADLPVRSAAVREADQATGTAGLASQRLLRLLDQTRLARDPRRIACVDAKLSEVNSFARMISFRRERLIEAEERGDEGAAVHAQRVIRSLVSQLRRVEREGRACVDSFVIAHEHTIVETELDPDLPDEDLAPTGPRS
jgi:hypothetical protein